MVNLGPTMVQSFFHAQGVGSGRDEKLTLSVVQVRNSKNWDSLAVFSTFNSGKKVAIQSYRINHYIK